MLPDVSKLTNADDAALGDFRARCASLGLTLEASAQIVSATESVQVHLRPATRRARLRARRDVRAIAMRALLFDDTVDEAEARTAFGDALPWMLDVGLLAPQESGRLAAAFTLALVDDLLVFGDDLKRGGEAAMGLAATTVHLALAAHPRRRVARALDLGCGAGAVALSLSRMADHVIASDVNPRALAFAAINARFNGVKNVEPRLGSLFEPVSGERFDVIASQPPFISRVAGAETATFMYGGARGDELALELLAHVPQHLAPGGLAALLVEWPDDGDRLDGRLARVVRGADVVVLASPALSVEEHASAYAAGMHPALDETFEAELARRIGHLDSLSIRGVVPTLTLVRARENGRTRVIAAAPLTSTTPTHARIAALLDAGPLAEDPIRLSRARLRFVEGTTLAQEQVGLGADRPSSIRARFSSEGMLAPVAMTEQTLLLLTCVHEAENVGRGIEQFAQAFEKPLDSARRAAMPIIERALLDGMLEER